MCPRLLLARLVLRGADRAARCPLARPDEARSAAGRQGEAAAGVWYDYEISGGSSTIRASPAVARGEATMLTDTQLAQFRQQLEAERARIRGTIGNLGDEVEQLGAYEE